MRCQRCRYVVQEMQAFLEATFLAALNKIAPAANQLPARFPTKVPRSLPTMAQSIRRFREDRDGNRPYVSEQRQVCYLWSILI